MKKFYFLFFLFHFFLFIHLTKASPYVDTLKKSYQATRISIPPKIDGLPDDSCWRHVPSATDFIQNTPNPGLPSKNRTEVKLAYDNNFIYVLAVMYDSAPDSILHELSTRDNVFYGPNADAFGILLDTYDDKQNAFMLSVSAAGVQADTKLTGSNFDDSWDAVWESKVKLTNYGWVAEYRIPYSAIRFPKKDIQTWGVNFFRQIRRYQEFSSWNKIDPKVSGMVVQSGTLDGVSKVKSPLRLSISPYISAYAQNDLGQNTSLVNGGADIKYGVNESFTLDATLVPDFGQVPSDAKVLNLSPFEIYYNEKRPFFLEGTELFNRAGIFYSRRVGGMPLLYDTVYNHIKPTEIVFKNPTEAQLYNAIKFSGRTKSKLGIGVFNALTAPVYATLKDTISGATRKVLTQPLANYNVLVLDQALKNNSYVSLINTNVKRDGSFYNANVTGTEFHLADKKNIFAIDGLGALSRLSFPNDSVSQGYKYQVALSKVSGNYTFYLGERVYSDKFNPNDLGFQPYNNQLFTYFNQFYNIYKPFSIFNQMGGNIILNYTENFNPRAYTSFGTNGNWNITFKNFFNCGFFGGGQPNARNYDYYLPLTQGRYYTYASNYFYGAYFNTDSRKKIMFSPNIGANKYNERNRHSIWYGFTTRYRFNDKFNLNCSFNFEDDIDDVGYVNNLPTGIAGANGTIILGVRDVSTFTNTLGANYLFTNRMSLSLNVRHYWSQAKYNSFFELNDAGKANPTNYNIVSDINQNYFSVDMIYTWQFLPGSEISVAWKNFISTSQSALLYDYWQNFDNTISAPQLNSFSIKILYYLDYEMLRKEK